MKEVFNSSLADIKTVFNSESDNTQYYDRLKNANCHIIDNVELAKPFIKSNDASIIWKSESNLTFESFNNLSDDRQAEVSFRLTNFFENFKQTIGRFKSVSPDFANQLIQIPNKNSILVNTDTLYIVIVNWGFLEDSFDRKENIIKHLFSKSKSSILVRIVNKKSNPVSDLNLKLNSETTREFDTTDTQGRARFGTLEKGENFSIYREKVLEEELLHDFECDGRKEYIITIDYEVKINLIVKDEFGEPIDISNYKVQIQGDVFENLNREIKNEYEFNTNVDSYNFKLLNQNGDVVFNHEIPDQNTTFEVVIESFEEEEALIDNDTDQNTEEEEKDDHKVFRFVTAFNRPLKELSVTFTDSSENTYTGVTDSKGEIQNEFLNSEINYSFERYRTEWNDKIDTTTGDLHIIKTRPAFPWLWWLLLAILLYLFICCAFFTCFTCNTINKSTTPPPTAEKINEVDESLNEEIQNCNSTTNSGGEGVTRTKHHLGSDPGTVQIVFDMQSVPDKLEVFYENKLVASTYEINGNVDGFVGGSLRSGCCGTLNFKYIPNKNDFCEVVVTGSNSTVWEYLMSCPK